MGRGGTRPYHAFNRDWRPTARHWYFFARRLMKIIRAPFLFSLACAAALLFCGLRAFAAPAVGVTQNGLEEIRALLDEKASWTPAQSKMESQLIHAMKSNRGQAFAAKAKNVQTDVALQPDGRVLVDIKANVTPRLLALIQ